MASLRSDAIDLAGFLESVFLSPPTRVEGTAVFLSSEQGVTPNALLHNLKHNKVLHDTNLFVNVRHHEVPWIPASERCEMRRSATTAGRSALHFGFKDEPDVPKALQQLRWPAAWSRNGHLLFPLARHRHPELGAGMADWREKLFASMHRNASAAADFLRLPTNRVVELGSKVEI